VRWLRLASWCALAGAIVLGTVADSAPERSPLFLGGYRVLTADLHVHTFPLSAATLAPWDVVIEARHQGLDAIAMSAHNQVASGKVGRWFSRMIGGPTILVGEEVHTSSYHLIAVGIDRTISWRVTAAQAIAETHRQGGIAIAAHPTRESWAGWGEAAAQLDGAEVLQPASLVTPQAAAEMRDFYARFPVAPIASSDYHGFGPLGLFRTYIFARDDSEQGVLEAIRQHRTVAFDGSRAYGDPALQALAAGRLPRPVPAPAPSGILGLVALVAVICCGVRQ
jgi:hypothetical protein